MQLSFLDGIFLAYENFYIVLYDTYFYFMDAKKVSMKYLSLYLTTWNK